MNKERFQPSGINNLLGCQNPLDPYPCVDKRLGPSIEYPLENQNYDLMRETYNWGKNQNQPDLLLPQLKQYKKLSDRDNTYVNTLNQRSTLYDGGFWEESSYAPISSPSNVEKESFTNLTPEMRLNWPECLPSNSFNNTTRSILTNSYPRNVLDGCNCPPDIQESKDKEKFSNLLVDYREQLRDSSFCGYYYDERGITDVYRYFKPSVAYDLPGYDSMELQEEPC